MDDWRAPRNWLEVLAPYCGETVPNTSCETRPGRWHMCEAQPDHERGETEHHICGCGRAWTTGAV